MYGGGSAQFSLCEVGYLLYSPFVLCILYFPAYFVKVA